jgi:hypothetical protein
VADPVLILSGPPVELSAPPVWGVGILVFPVVLLGIAARRIWWALSLDLEHGNKADDVARADKRADQTQTADVGAAPAPTGWVDGAAGLRAAGRAIRLAL